MPAVSVLMVFHRDTPFLRPAIASVCRQTLHDFELLLVDNGTGLSPDALGELGRDPRLKWLRLEENQGIAAGINAGIDQAQAEFIALLDYDDLMRPERLEQQLSWLTKHADHGLVASGAATIDESGREIGRQFCLAGAEAHRTYSAYYSGAIMPTFMGRTTVFRQLRFRPQFRWSSDFDFLSRAAEQTKIDVVPRVLLDYRRYAQQTTLVHRCPQVLEECYVRLLTGRRRRGDAENFPAVAAELQTHAVPQRDADVHAEFAERFLAEVFFAQAVYQARRLAVTRRDLAGPWQSLRILRRTLKTAPSVQRSFLIRLFLFGPVRAHGLRDVGSLLPA